MDFAELTESARERKLSAVADAEDLEAESLIKPPPQLASPAEWIVRVWKLCKEEARHGRTELEINCEDPGDPADSAQPVEFAQWLENAQEVREKHGDRLHDFINDAIDERRRAYLNYLVDVFRAEIPTADLLAHNRSIYISWSRKRIKTGS